MKTSLPEDVARLAQAAGFELKAYREFEKTPRPRLPVAPTTGVPNADVKSADQPTSPLSALSLAVRHATDVGEATSRAPLSSGRSVASREREYPLPVPSEVQGNRDHAFRALRELTHQTRSPHLGVARTTLALFSSSGGCGVTTIAATLGRLLSEMNEPVLLVEEAPRSLLAAHFGVSSLRSGIRSIVHTGGAGSANVHVASQSDGAAGEWLAETAGQLDGEFARMIVDVSPHLGPVDLRRALRGAVGLVPVLADLRTVVGIETLFNRLSTLSAENGATLPIYFVLSQFDPNVSLHREVREWMRRTYGAMLLPVTLRRSDEVSEALAEGETVIDYAPDSGIALDFRSLAEWVLRLPQAAART